jgi:hypothetical protein
VDGFGFVVSDGHRAWLTYSISLLNGLLRLSTGAPDIGVSLVVTAAFGLVLLLASGVVANTKSLVSNA